MIFQFYLLFYPIFIWLLCHGFCVGLFIYNSYDVVSVLNDVTYRLFFVIIEGGNSASLNCNQKQITTKH
jgi:hypothetical protein